MNDTTSPESLVATLIAAPNAGLQEALLDQAQSRMTALGGSSVSLDWLAPNTAVDLFVTGATVEALRDVLREIFQSQPVDIIVQPAAKRRKKLLVADMESTIIEQEMLDELAAAIGVGERVADITRRAMNGELDFTAAIKERVGLLKGQPMTLLAETAKHISFMPGAAALVATMRKNDAQCWLVSGGFTCFAAPIAMTLGFSEAFANRLMVDTENGTLTGGVFEPILDKNTKKALLERGCFECNVTLSDTIAVGDGANDVPMLSASNDGDGLGVAFHAKPSVRAVVPHQVTYGDLTALLFAQGYHESEFATSQNF